MALGIVVALIVIIAVVVAGKKSTTSTAGGSSPSSAANRSSPTSPVAFGQTASVDGWTVKIVSVAPESTDPTLLHGPPAGYLFEVTTLQVTRTDSSPNAPITLDPVLLGPSKAGRSVNSEPTCFGGKPYNNQVHQGGTVETSDCISVPTSDGAALVIGVGIVTRTWFATK